MLSSTIGPTMLCFSGTQPWARFPELWADWWLGDALGALVIAPVILTLARTPPLSRWPEWIEIALLVAATALITHAVFGPFADLAPASAPLEYVVFPFVIAAAVRLAQPATSLVVLAAAAVTLADTVSGAGPFAGAEAHRSLVLLQTFMAVLAGTGLVLAAAITERETGDRRRAAAYAVSEVLTGMTSVSAIGMPILRAVCENLDWPVGVLWLLDRQAGRLRAAAVWHRPEIALAEFDAATRAWEVVPGAGLPGRVWAEGRPVWIEDVGADPGFFRAFPARRVGIRGAFAVPIRVGTDVLGVIECYNQTVVSPDEDLLRTLTAVGNSIGQFLERGRVESEVLEGQRHTRAILETALDAIIGMDHRGLVTEFNPAAERMFGFRRAEAVGRELAALIIPGELRDQHREGIVRFLATGAGPFLDRRVETYGLHASGRSFPVEVAITKVADAPPRFTGFVRDLTTRRDAERERDDLLQRELRARQDAEAANRAKDDFLATLSHELRTPLNAILGWTRMLLDGTMDEESVRKALQVVDRNARLQARLVEDILDVSRIISGGLTLDLQPVALDTVIGAALDAVRPAADARHIQLRSRLAAASQVTEGDPERLQQIVWNLLANAVKFTDPGGVVTVELEGAGDWIRIRVSDTGIGIEPEFLPHIYDRFRQADGSVSRRFGGLGLGLAIVRHLVDRHGGTVSAASGGRGQGATFTVELRRFDSARALAKLDLQPR